MGVKACNLFFIQFRRTKYPDTQETETNPLKNFRSFQFSVPVFGRDAMPASTGLELWKPPK